MKKPEQQYKTEEELKREALIKHAEDAKLEATKPKTEAVKKRENFWYHYKWHTIIAVFALAVSIFFIKDMFFRTRPDATIIMVTGEYVFPENIDRLTSAIEEVAEDYNGDNKVSILIDSITLPNKDAEFQSQQDMASLMKLSAVVATGADPIFLLDDAGFEYLYNMGGENAGELFSPDVMPVDAEKLGGKEVAGMRFYLRNNSGGDKYYEYCKELIKTLYGS